MQSWLMIRYRCLERPNIVAVIAVTEGLTTQCSSPHMLYLLVCIPASNVGNCNCRFCLSKLSRTISLLFQSSVSFIELFFLS